MSSDKSGANLRFMANEAGIKQGMGNAGINIFKSNPYASVARECGQNSSDARAISPVIVSFDLLDIKANELPSLDSFQSSISRCLEEVKKENTEKDVAFFLNAKEMLERESIKILRIADRNTTGLVGPCQDGTPFFSLVKGDGVSNKPNDTSGGSFGIGKNAAYAISDIQTVFYSTRYVDEKSGTEKFLCQGKTILVSHTDKNNEPKLATGWWGLPSFLPVESTDDVPEWLRRAEIGTSLFAIACRESPNWEAGLAASLLQNFFCAIYREEMIFSVNNGNTKITKETLQSLFDSSYIKQAAVDSGHEEDFEFSRALYSCLKAIEAKEEIIAIPKLGEVAIRILVRDSLPKRVCIVRNGMYIADNLENFGEKFRRFPLYKDFVALVEPRGHEAVAFFRNLENPQHDGFSSERLSTAEDRNTAAQIMKQLAKKIRDVIKLQSLERPSDSVVINELSEFFADQVNPENLQDPNAAEEDPERYKYKPTKRQPPKRSASGEDADGSEGGSGQNGGEGGDSGGKGSGNGSGAGGAGNSSGGKAILIRETRNIIANSQPQKRRLFFTPAESTKASVSVFATGVNNKERLQIIDADIGEIASGSVIVELAKDVKITFTIEFADEYDGPIEIFARSLETRGANEN